MADLGLAFLKQPTISTIVHRDDIQRANPVQPGGKPRRGVVRVVIAVIILLSVPQLRLVVIVVGRTGSGRPIVEALNADTVCRGSQYSKKFDAVTTYCS
jgi:hypothetical protein